MGLRYGVIDRVDCAHHLEGAGLCEAVHGHTFTVEVLAEGPCSDGSPLGLDALKQKLRQALAPYDHRDLNEIFGDPTCEAFAQALHRDLKTGLPGLCTVKVWEGYGQWAETGA